MKRFETLTRGRLAAWLLQVALPAPKAGARKGCAAVLAAAEGAGADGPAPQDSDADEDSDLMDEDGEAGACAICYALHLPDPSRPEELGKGNIAGAAAVLMVLA